MIDGNGQPVFRHVKIFGQKFPGPADGIVFEIVSERKVAEHFKKSMVPHVIADTVKVVVFPARPDRFLGSRRSGIIAGFVAGQNVFELHHSRIGKHQCRIVVGNQRTRRHNLMPVLGKKV